jgi:hypothetical protein
LIGLLSRGARHGYEIRRALAEDLGPEWRLDFGLIPHLFRGQLAGRVDIGGQRSERLPAPRARCPAIGGRWLSLCGGNA